jgi:hypothetical protein
MAIIRAYIKPPALGVKGVVNYQLNANDLAALSVLANAKGYLGRLRKGSMESGFDRDYETGEYQQPTAADLLNSGTVSRFGRPVFSDIIFTLNDQDIAILNARIEVSLNNTIVKTAVQGRRGSVKEYVSAEDYRVRIEGSIIGEAKDIYPVEQVKAFVQLIEHEGPIEVISEYLSLFGIFNLVLENHSFRTRQGYQNIEDFTLNYISDLPMSLIVEQEATAQDFTRGF